MTNTQGAAGLSETSKQLLLDQAVALFGNWQYAERKFLQAQESLHRAVGMVSAELRGEYAEITERMRAVQDERDETMRQRRLAARRATARTEGGTG